MSWNQIDFGEIAEFRNGVNYTAENYAPGIKIISVADFQDYSTPQYSNLREIDPTGVVSDGHILETGDIVFVRSNGNKDLIGRSMLIVDPPEPITFSAFCIRARFISPEVHPQFYAHLFKSNLIRQTLSAYGSGTNISNLNQSILHHLKVPLPPLDTQRRIADILTAYDDLIANNARRMAFLEEAMHLLYYEWFVRLHFPSHEHTSIIDGVPAGWEKVSVTAVIDFKPQTPFPKDEVRPFVPMDSLSTNSMIIEGIEERPIEGGAKFMNGDTLLARITPCLENGKTAFVQFLASDQLVASGSTEFIVMRSISVSPFWTYCLARSHNFRQHAINSMVGSDGRQRVKPEAFEKYELAKPSNSILQHFDELVKPMFRQIQTLAEQNQRLREARDLLLPRLMNGVILL